MDRIEKRLKRAQCRIIEKRKLLDLRKESEDKTAGTAARQGIESSIVKLEDEVTLLCDVAKCLHSTPKAHAARIKHAQGCLNSKMESCLLEAETLEATVNATCGISAKEEEGFSDSPVEEAH